MTKSKIRILFIFVTVLIFQLKEINAGNQQEKKLKNFPVDVVVDKIRGGLLGEILGNLNGIPHENKYINEPGNVKNYVPGLPDGARTDDDTDFEWVS